MASPLPVKAPDPFMSMVPAKNTASTGQVPPVVVQPVSPAAETAVPTPPVTAATDTMTVPAATARPQF
jgi:hypothetical protein